MSIPENQPLCVVLNNQHRIRLDEYLALHHKDPSRKVLFQPYTGKAMRQVRGLLRDSGGPVPILMVVGDYGQFVSAIGLLHALEYRDEVTPDREQEMRQLVSVYDDSKLYAFNILSVTNLVQLRKPFPLSRLLKRSNGLPLKPGRWPVSVCFAPPLTLLLEAL